VSRLEAAIFDRYASDRAGFGNVLEPSLSTAGDAVHRYRFSYGFPRFRDDEAAVADVVVRAAEALGGRFRRSAVEAARKAMLASAHECVRMPIVGVAFDGAQPRFKVYLLFHAGSDAAARALAREVLGAHDEPRQPGEIHMVGLDVGERGVIGAKLYFEHRGYALPAGYALRPRVLSRVLAIHALSSPDEESDRPSAIDFAVGDQVDALDAGGAGASWPELEAELEPAFPAGIRAFNDIASRFRLRVRRVSVFGEPRKLNVYYVLDEREAAQ